MPNRSIRDEMQNIRPQMPRPAPIGVRRPTPVMGPAMRPGLGRMVARDGEPQPRTGPYQRPGMPQQPPGVAPPAAPPPVMGGQPPGVVPAPRPMPRPMPPSMVGGAPQPGMSVGIPVAPTQQQAAMVPLPQSRGI